MTHPHHSLTLSLSLSFSSIKSLSLCILIFIFIYFSQLSPCNVICRLFFFYPPPPSPTSKIIYLIYYLMKAKTVLRAKHVRHPGSLNLSHSAVVCLIRWIFFTKVGVVKKSQRSCDPSIPTQLTPFYCCLLYYSESCNSWFEQAKQATKLHNEFKKLQDASLRSLLHLPTYLLS